MRNHLWITATLCSCVLFAGAEEPAYRRGVNIAGAEFGSLPGTRNKHYTYNNEATYAYFGKKGFDVARVPVKWERLQPELNGPLDKDELAELKKNAAWAKTHGQVIIIDVHNYGRRRVKVGDAFKSCVIDVEVEGEARVKTADFAAFWAMLSAEFKDDEGVWAYGLMNEPHGMGTADWKAISNGAIKAIRAAGDKKMILVAGDHWSNALNWERHNGAESWVQDPENRFLYEAHCYFDADNSGSYKKTYEEELKSNPNLPEAGRRRVQGFIEWCRKNKVGGFLGEYGVPRDDPRWNEVLENFMQALDEAKMGGTYWAAGIFWGDKYPLTVHPADKFTTDRPQMQVLEKHLAPKSAPSKAAEPQPDSAAPKP